jgi:diguanylate cyclase (GGDEF)-like protein
MNKKTPAFTAEMEQISTREQANAARNVALISLVSPILFMASLVSAALLLMTDLGRNSGIFGFWLMGQCLVCGALFLLSLRERSELFDGSRFSSSMIKKFSFVGLSVSWGVVPGILALIDPSTPHLVFGAILSGATLSAAVLLQYMPKLGRLILAVTVGGFLSNVVFQPDLQSAAVSMIMLAYFSGLAVCTRWYFARFSRQINEVEESIQRAKDMNSVLRDVGYSTNTCFWRTNASGHLVELSSDAQFGHEIRSHVLGKDIAALFSASGERDLLKARMARGSEIVALELEVDAALETGLSSWRLSARPIFTDGAFTGYQGAATDVSTVRTAEKRAAFLAEYDSLTGFLNRASLTQVIKAHLEAPVNETHESGLIWIDLDNFKWINDTFGHDGGDEILRLVKARIEAETEANDRICRWGGDEFAILATRKREGDELVQFVERLTKALQAPYSLADTDAQCGASLGLRRIDAEAKDVETLMQEADLALYAAKTSGRSSWKEYSDAFKAKIRGQRELAADLKLAVEQDTLSLQYQPIVDPETGAIVAIEALSRWYHPTRGAVSPAEFIPIAEDNGLIVALGDRVVEKALEVAKLIPDSVRVSVNISPLQIHSNRLFSLIEEKLAETGVSPDRLELEITESVFLSDNAFILERLQRLKALGVRIALDDFGTGFSSLAYLQRFPFDKLKLDQAFVRGIETSDQSCAIARATISMAHALDLTVTAEGVESEAQAEFLRIQGCDELQGYLFSRPQNEDAIGPYLRSMRLVSDTRAETADGNVIKLAKL